MSIGTYTSIINLNINRLNAPTKTYRLTGYKNKTHIYAAYKRPTSDLERLKVKRWKKIFHANGNQKKVRVAILTLDK